MMSAIEVLNIQEKSGGMLKEYNYLDSKYYVVPNVIGMSKEDATKALKGFKIKYTGSGDKVIYMSPFAGTFQSEETTITLMLN